MDKQARNFSKKYIAKEKKNKIKIKKDIIFIMTSIVLTVPLCLINSLLSMLPILPPSTNLSLSTNDTASKKNMHLLISLVLAIENQSSISNFSYFFNKLYNKGYFVAQNKPRIQ
jgi:hypothetical protein